MTDRLVLITGGAGFIGSHLVSALLEEGAGVRIFDSLEAQVHGEDSERPSIKGAELVRGDVRDPDALDEVLEGVSEVVHLASAVGVGQSMYEIVSYCETNVMGTATLLEALVKRRDHIRKLLVASSMSIYGEGLYHCDGCDQNRIQERRKEDLDSGRWEPLCPVCGRELKPLPTPESKPLFPSSVYAVNKRDQEELCLSVGRAYGIPTVAMRFFNVYGPGQSLGNPYTGAAAIFAARLLGNAPPLIFEDGEQSRDFLHVSDVASACIKALSLDAVTDVSMNIGTGNPTTISQLADLLRGRLGGPEPEFLGNFRPGDIRHCFADPSLAIKTLKWEPRVELADGVVGLAEWVQTQVGDADLQDAALAELRDRSLL